MELVVLVVVTATIFVWQSTTPPVRRCDRASRRGDSGRCGCQWSVSSGRVAARVWWTTRSAGRGLASATQQKHQRCDRRKGKADDKKQPNDWHPFATTAVIDGIVMSERTDHELRFVLPIPSRQLRLKVLPLLAGLGDGS